MNSGKYKTDTSTLTQAIIHGMKEKKALGITLLDLTHIQNAVASYFVICSGNSDTQVKALTDSVEEEVYKACGEQPWQREGTKNLEWVLIDYADVVVHIFIKHKRDFYGLEELWGDAVVNRIDE